MLSRNGATFSTGRAEVSDRLPGDDDDQARIYVRVKAPPLEEEIVAQLDTGAPWLILKPEILEAVGLVGTGGAPASLQTRLGLMHGHLERTTLVLVADEGNSVEIDAAVFVCETWPKGNFVGYAGVLERVRFAVDSVTNSFFFGPVD